MRVPKNIERYARKYVSSGKVQYLKEVTAWLSDNTDFCYEEIINIYIVSKPFGALIDKDEYCYQWLASYEEDYFQGYYYLRFANSGDYLKIYYEL